MTQIRKNRNIRTIPSNNKFAESFGELICHTPTPDSSQNDVSRSRNEFDVNESSYITDNNTRNYYNNEFYCDTDKLRLDLQNLKCGDESDNSSSSWSTADFEEESSKKVFDSLKDLDDAVRGLKISDQYDMEEIQAWKNIRADIRILECNKPSSRRKTYQSLESVSSDSESSATYDGTKEKINNKLCRYASNSVKKLNRHLLKPKSLELGLKSPRMNRRKNSATSLFNAKLSLEKSEMDTPRNSKRKGLHNRELILPQISNNYRSVSAISRNPQKSVRSRRYSPGIAEEEFDFKTDLMKFLSHVSLGKQ